MTKERTQKCAICKKSFAERDLFPLELMREPIVDLIKKEHPRIDSSAMICFDDLRHYRVLGLSHYLTKKKGALAPLEKNVIHSLDHQEYLSQNIAQERTKPPTLGERWADKVASFGGSWTFIILFLVILLIWIGMNTFILFFEPFDPYPYIFLNLILSCLAAIQAPVIMMSQNRQEAKDRVRAEHDYQINLKAEVEIRHLQVKMDHLMKMIWERFRETDKKET